MIIEFTNLFIKFRKQRMHHVAGPVLYSFS